MATELPIAKVGFGIHAVSLYFVPEGGLCLKRNMAIELGRDGELGESDPNVRWLRHIERAANAAREQVSA
jgi:hypothetical protein